MVRSESVTVWLPHIFPHLLSFVAFCMENLMLFCHFPTNVFRDIVSFCSSSQHTGILALLCRVVYSVTFVISLSVTFWDLLIKWDSFWQRSLPDYSVDLIILLKWPGLVFLPSAPVASFSLLSFCMECFHLCTFSCLAGRALLMNFLLLVTAKCWFPVFSWSEVSPPFWFSSEKEIMQGDQAGTPGSSLFTSYSI